MNTIRQILSEGRKRLESACVEDASLSADLLIAFVLNTERARLPLLWEDNAPPEAVERFFALVQRRIAHEPLQYLLGTWSFLDFSVKVGPEALIPRPETEELLLAVVAEIERARFRPDFTFVDICTGSGVLGIALARKFNQATGWISDISAEALRIAAQNLAINLPGQRSRVAALQGDLLSTFAENSLDLVIANPPYICSADISGLMPEVRDFEPILALDGGPDGLELIRTIFVQAVKCLRPGGILAFEHGHGQRQSILALAKGFGAFSLIDAADDLCGCERYVIIKAEK